jgi:ketosteroid isomerase-like protein
MRAAFRWSGYMEVAKLGCGIAFVSRGSGGPISRCRCGKLKPRYLFRIEDKTMLKLNSLALRVLAFLPIAAIAQTTATSAVQTQNANDQRANEIAIEQVMKQYHAAILAHDGTALAALFLPDANLWLNVLTDAAYAREQAKSPNAQKVRISNYQDFAKLVSTTPRTFDPEHSNIVIHTDGTIAVVYFDFVFNVDGKANNRGSETWQLVKAADGWRIASIIYSSQPPPSGSK